VDLDKRFQNYRIEPGTCTASQDEKLFNGSVAADGRGYETFRNERGPSLNWGQTIWNALLLPMKRHYGEPWFQPVVRYGAISIKLPAPDCTRPPYYQPKERPWSSRSSR
jgi:hypothetical protein